MLKVVVLAIILFNFSFAYKLNDKLDNQVIQKLNLKEDKVYILNFFASWCVSCKEELPILSKMKLSENVQIIGVNVDEEKEEGLTFVNDLNLNFKVIYDTDNKIISKFNPIGVPAIYYIKDFKVQKRLFGAINHIDKLIQRDLKALEQ